MMKSITVNRFLKKAPLDVLKHSKTEKKIRMKWNREQIQFVRILFEGLKLSL